VNALIHSVQPGIVLVDNILQLVFGGSDLLLGCEKVLLLVLDLDLVIIVLNSVFVNGFSVALGVLGLGVTKILSGFL